jgi:hypothetical protein
MAIFKANHVKRGRDATKRAKASIRYIQNRRGKDGEKISRTLFNSYGPMDRYEAYSIIDDAPKGAYFYRFIISPDPKREDHNHDLDMRDIATQTMLALEELLGVGIQWVGATHADHAPHLHAHLIAVVPKRLYIKDFQALRQKATEASLEQRELLDLLRGHEREWPYPLPTVARTAARYARQNRHQAGKWGRYEHAGSQRASRYGGSGPLRTCVCPRCMAVHIHTSRDPAHRCSCGLILHRKKALSLTREGGRERERSL